MHHHTSKLHFLILAFVFTALLFAPFSVTAAPSQAPLADLNGKPGDPADPGDFYDLIEYEEIGPRLQQIAKDSNRVRFEVIGQSAGGRDMYLVTLSDPKSMGRLGFYQKIRKLMLEDPTLAQELIEKNPDFKVPVFINASIHGDEYPGVDAAIRLIETLAYEDTPEVQAILENVILLVNVVANPDGRVQGTRSNANGFDLNRDFITQSQPETRAMVEVITEWNPMVVLDLHGFYYPMLIEPCTPLHNPNYEYDLYIKWALDEALAMEAELLAQTGFKAQIPFLDDATGWDDWAPTYTPMYAMFHGAYGHTLETTYQDERGVAAHYAAVWGALKFVSFEDEDSDRSMEMIYDQIEIFRRGFLDLPQMLIPDDLLALTKFDQWNDLTVKEFPAAYIIPATTLEQLSSHQAARLVDFLLANDVQVSKSTDKFIHEGVEYPKGTYIVWMDQPKRGLANTILEYGLNLSDLEGISFYSPPSVWSNLLLWGASGVIVPDEEDENETFDVETVPISTADQPQGSIDVEGADYYAFEPVNLNAFRAANDLLKRGESLYRTNAGSFIIPEYLASELAEGYALDLFVFGEEPDGVLLTEPSLAVIADEGTAHALKTMGFDFDVLSQGDLNTGQLGNYDVFVNLSASWGSLGPKGHDSFIEFIKDGGDYVGLKAGGANFAVDIEPEDKIIDASVLSGSGNAIVAITLDTEDTIAAGFREQDYAFVNSPVWFTDIGDTVVEDATMGWENNQNEFLVSGYWPGWEGSGAGGMPVVIHSSPYDGSVVTLIGLDTTFRGHPENTFRLLGNAIFAGIRELED